ncbi:MAG: hypothetical protein ACREXS_02755 [Gammaproteobacteria bacterium]
MTTELIVGGALANCGRDAPTDEFLQQLVRETPDLAIFRFRPRPRPGWGVKAALDWQAILGTGADLLAFAGVLWAAYERYVKPKLHRSDGTTKPFLFINLRRPDGTSVQFTLGNEYKDKEIFVEQFTRQVTELRAVSDAEEGRSLLSELIENEDWVRVYVRDRKDS